MASFGHLSCAEKEPERPIPPLTPGKVVDEEQAKFAKTKQKQPPPSPSEPAITPGRLTRMPLGDLYQLVEKDAAVIYDVRPTISHRLGNIPNSISWPKRAFDKDFAKHAPAIRRANQGNTPVVLYCTDMACPDATDVGTKLAAKGYSVSVLQGGYAAWKVAVD